jgi:hypothetical protein
MRDDVANEPEREPDSDEPSPGAGEPPDSIDVQPEDPNHPGRDSPDPID